MKIFFDLDGTLIDSKQRLYQLFQYLIPQSGFTFEKYWMLKREKITHKIILEKYFKFQDLDLNEFENNWMQLIEDDEWLKLDKPFEGVSEYLLKLKKNDFSLYLITARQNRSKLNKQLETFGWENIFTEILVTEQKTEKIDLISPFLSDEIQSWIVGDTGNDIITGKSLGQKTVAVLSGFQNKKILQSYKPDLIVENVIDFSPSQS